MKLFRKHSPNMPISTENYDPKTITDNGSFCVLPWIHLHSWPNGIVVPCCISNFKYSLGNLNKNTIAEIVNSDKSKEIRLKMLDGEKVSSCENCYNVEKYKGFSWRNEFNKHFEEKIPGIINGTQDDGTIDPKLLYVDFRFSNFCNLGCRTCGGDLSSSIASTPGRELPEKQLTAYKETGLINQSNVISFTNTKPTFINDDLKQYLVDTECFYFAGGEPLIQKEHFEILSYLYEQKWFDKELRYSSNLSTLKYKNHNLLDYWKEFDKVRFIGSIDHYGDKLEYIRQNVDSNRVFENMETLFQYHFLVCINTVVSIYNIYDLYDFYAFLDEKGYIENLDRIDIVYAFGELHTPGILPEFAKQELLDKLEKDLKSDLYKKLFDKYPSFGSAIQGLPNYINDGNPDDFKNFVGFANRLDKTYGKNLASSFPWLGSVIKRTL